MKHFFPVLGLLMTLAPLATPAPPAAPVPVPAPASAAVPAPATALPGEGPRARFAETSFEFGKIKSSDVVKHEFIVTNTGNAVLELTEVRPGCPGCTTVLPWDRQIQPGQSGKIPVQFNPASFSGPIGKSVTVLCNDPTQPTVALQFHATVWRPIEVQPSFVYFTSVEGETNDVKVVHITNHLDEPLTLETPQSSNPSFQTEIKTVVPGKDFHLLVRYTGPISNTTAQGFITVKTSATNLPMVSISAQANIQPAFAIMPTQITLPAGTLDKGHRHSQVIRNNSNVPMKITDAAVNAERVTVQITEPQPGKFFVLAVSFPPQFQAPPGVSMALTIHTTHPKHAVIKVPIVPAAAAAPVARTSAAATPATAK